MKISVSGEILTSENYNVMLATFFNFSSSIRCYFFPTSLLLFNANEAGEFLASPDGKR